MRKETKVTAKYLFHLLCSLGLAYSIGNNATERFGTGTFYVCSVMLAHSLERKENSK